MSRTILIGGVSVLTLLIALGPSRATYNVDDRLPIIVPASPEAQSAPAAKPRHRHPTSPRKAVAPAPTPDAGRPSALHHAERPGGPLQIVISLDQQSLTVFSAGEAVAHSRVSTGVPGHPTPTGAFSIIQKNRFHRSNIYSGAPMPFMQRITWSGVALHEGVVPGRPASHGCIRLPTAFAKQLWGWTKLGARVVVTRGAVTPVEIAHPRLAALMPPHAPVAAKTPDSVAPTPRADSSESGPPRALVRVAAATEIATDALPGATTPPEPHAEAQAPASIDVALPDYPPAIVLDAAEPAPPAVATARRMIGIEDAAASAAQAAGQLTAAAAPAVEPATVPPAAEATVDLALPDYPPMLTIEAATASAPAEAARVDGATLATVAIISPDYPPPAVDIPLSELAAALPFERPVQKGPVSVFISRKERKLYVRQDFHALFSAPVQIERPDAPLGTHIFTALGANADGEVMRWNVLTLPTSPEKRAERAHHSSARTKHAKVQTANDIVPHHTLGAAEALERVTIPPAVAQRVFAFMAAGSSLTISDQGLGPETGRGTDFIVLTR
jgi:lipoprotein-anchoring transpeptidase ErfK/SrfK